MSGGCDVHVSVKQTQKLKLWLQGCGKQQWGDEIKDDDVKE